MKPAIVMPLSYILRQTKELIEKGYDPKSYLAHFLVSDDGGELRNV